MPLIGTAGHVDHGKSTLIQRLTGRDPDRWAEEKRRGLTIDLGFAWTTLPDGSEVSFVDVPGHERYLKNMLAGIEAIDVAMFVVAADEGWMPQSEEHLAVLDLLEVNKGVIALTKLDLVEPDLLELAQAEVAEKLVGTSLAEAAITPVSGVTGQGVGDLVAELEHLLREVEPIDLGRPRLWVDRSFSATGAGTIVTGSLLDGPFGVDEGVAIYPHLTPARVKGIQSHERAVDSVAPGRRVALNLGGVDREQVSRGDMVGKPEQWDTSSRFVSTIRTARYLDELDQRGAFQLHIGSGVHPVEFTGLEGEVAVLQTPHPLPMAVGDRFIVRDTGRRLVVAGGRVLDPHPGRTRAAMAAARTIDPDSSPDGLASALLSMRGIDERSRIEAHSKGGTPSGGRAANDVLISDDAFDGLVEESRRLVAKAHETHPLRAGLSIATLAEQMGVAAEVTELVVDETADLVRTGAEVAVLGREIQLGAENTAEWDVARVSLSMGLAVPTTNELGLDPELLHLQIRRGELVRISDDFVLLPEQAAQLRDLLQEMPEEFKVSDFRDAAGLSRKYAVPFLEWADKEGLTVRRGDTRRLR